MQKPGAREAGSTIVGVLVALAILSLVAVFYSSGKGQQAKAEYFMQQKERYLAIESAVSSEAAAFIQSLTPTACLPRDELLARPFAFGGVGVKLRLAEGLAYKGVKISKVQEAYERCKSPVLISPEDVENSNKARLHFCMTIDARGEEKDRQETLVEYEIRLYSTGRRISLSCGAFQRDRSAVAQIAYGIYVVDQKGSSVKQGLTIVRSVVKDEP